MTTRAPQRYRHLLAAFAGVALPFAILVGLAQPWRIELDGWDNYYLSDYPADFAAIPKHLIIGTGCWTWTIEAYMPLDSHDAVRSQRATLHSALNATLEGTGPERFYGFGRADVDFNRHLMSIRLAVQQGDVRSIIYINNPGSLQAFTIPANAVRVLPVLAAIESDYPELADDVETYRRHLLASAGYRKGMAEQAAKPWFERLGERMSVWAWGVSRRWHGILEGLIFTPFPAHRRADDHAALLRQVQANYANPNACTAPGRGLMAADLYWIGAGGAQVWQSWLRIAAGMAARHGIAFVYYIPPHLNVPRDRYAAEFRPAFVDQVHAVLAEFPKGRVIDHAVEHGLSACDQVYDSERRFSSGYLLNYAGKLKQSRLLLAEMARAGLVAAPPERFLGRSRFEQTLPASDVPPRILSDDASEKVREELFANEEWRLSLPAAD